MMDAKVVPLAVPAQVAATNSAENCLSCEKVHWTNELFQLFFCEKCKSGNLITRMVFDSAAIAEVQRLLSVVDGMEMSLSATMGSRQGVSALTKTANS